MTRPASLPGRLLEPCGDARPRGMAAHDRTRLIGRLHVLAIEGGASAPPSIRRVLPPLPLAGEGWGEGKRVAIFPACPHPPAGTCTRAIHGARPSGGCAVQNGNPAVLSPASGRREFDSRTLSPLERIRRTFPRIRASIRARGPQWLQQPRIYVSQSSKKYLHVRRTDASIFLAIATGLHTRSAISVPPFCGPKTRLIGR